MNSSRRLRRELLSDGEEGALRDGLATFALPSAKTELESHHITSPLPSLQTSKRRDQTP